MVFPTLQFAIFLVVLLALLFIFRRSTPRKLILLAASWAFYMAWNPAFIFLLLGLCFFDYFAAKLIHQSADPRIRRILLVGSMAANLGMLAFFKYAHFFSDTTLWVFKALHMPISWELGAIILPVGISFHTFQSMSYTIDVYRKEMPPAHDLLDFLLFVAFFPQLVAGPIVRAIDFLPQLRRPVQLRFEPEAVMLITSGLLKKVLVADNLSPYVDAIMKSPHEASSLGMMLATVCFSTQIYCDFSGYSEIAIGLGRLFGYWFPQNFNRPYFALNPSEFWRKWHMSLSTWLRDYLYIGLGGNRHGELMTYRNLFLTMLLGGLWHGASWNFVAWGAFHGLLLIGHRLLSRGIERVPGLLRIARSLPLRLLSWAFFQYTVLISWILFRLTDSHELVAGLKKFILFDGSHSLRTPNSVDLQLTLAVLGCFWLFHTLERFFHFKEALQRRGLLWLVLWVAFCTALLIMFWPSKSAPFIYFQF